MCGINGILGRGDNLIDQVMSMNEAIIHRGPDGGGVWQSDDGCVTFGHRRLSILDLSETGSQPMTSQSREFTIVFNGEIYNYLSLKKEMLEEYPDISFKGSSDTEYLLNAIEKYGIEDTLSKIKGMFAFAVYERKTGRVILARDRMGEKPLYYGMVGKRFVFASDLASMERLSGFDNEINGDILRSYFLGGYIPAPYTIYKDIYKLTQGSFLTLEPPYDKWEQKVYWSVENAAVYGCKHPFEGSFNDACEELERLIKASVRGQMIADVPLGAFLSGGIDSTLTVACMQSMSEQPIRSFTIGFEDPKYNEAQYAAESAKHLGTRHTEMYVTRKDILDTIENIPLAFSEPFADSSQIPTMLVSRMTRQHVTVSLSGDAGDEFYCGYNTYKDVRRGLEILTGKLPFVKGGLRKALGQAALLGSSSFAGKLAAVCNVTTAEDWYRNVRADDLRLLKLAKSKNPLSDNIDIYRDGLLGEPEHDLMLMDMQQYLPDDILVKVDRAGMFYSLESRIPLLDRDVMEFAWSLPLEYKYDGNVTKRILKSILYKYVPEEMMDRPKKGFSVPLADWLRGSELKPWAEELIHDSSKLMGDYVDHKTVLKMWQEFLATGQGERNIWNILMLAGWFERRR